MMRNFLEFGLLEYKDLKEISKIHHGELQWRTALLINDKNQSPLFQNFNKKLEEEVEKLRKAPDLIDAQDTIASQIKPIEIHSLNDHEIKIIDYAHEFEKIIESTQSNLIWQGKRGNIKYFPEQSALASRGNQVVFKRQ